MLQGRSQHQGPSRCNAVLIIGIHRDELAFGDRVAAGLEPSFVDVLRIPEGLSGQHPRPDEVFHYEILHRELYHQLLGQIRGRYSLALDLHCGLDERGPCVDLISANEHLLIGAQQRAVTRFGEIEGSRILRPVILETAHTPLSRKHPVPAHTVIPPEIWNAPTFDYVGIEVYLPCQGNGSPRDWELARWVIRTVVEYRQISDHGPSR